jgi:cellobiose transport system substrate-binding protein
MKWTRSRTATVLAVGAASALLLSACSPSDDDTSPSAAPTSEGPKEDVTLTVAYWGNFGLESLADQYMTDNPHVTITLNSGDFAAQHEALQQALINGSGAPNVAAIDTDFIVGCCPGCQRKPDRCPLYSGRTLPGSLSKIQLEVCRRDFP